MMEESIKKFLVSPNPSVVELMKILDKTAKGILYVINEEEELIGTITDGDIRRAILKTGKLDMTAGEVMKKDPVITDIEGRDKAISLMIKNGIRSIPYIGKNNKILDIYFLEENESAPKKEKIDVPVVIMAGGKGMRLKPYTNILPKPLIPVGEKTITEHIIERFRDAGCSDFKMIVNYKKHLIKAYFRDNEIKEDIEFIDETEFLGTCGGLRLLMGGIEGSFFVSNCDILIEEDYSKILEYHKKANNLATIVCAIRNMQLPYGVVETTEEGQITRLREKPDISSIVNTGLYVLEQEFLEKIPEGEVSQITDVFQKCLDEGERIGMYPVSEDRWMDIGQLDELQRMTDRLEEMK